MHTHMHIHAYMYAYLYDIQGADHKGSLVAGPLLFWALFFFGGH